MRGRLWGRRTRPTSAATGSRPEPLEHAFWGPGHTSAEVVQTLESLKLPFRVFDEPERAVAGLLASGHVVGRFQGRSECGPRALGNRSILALPSKAGVRDRINAEIKGREWWRPFAASILDERRADYLAVDGDFPFMLQAVPLTSRGATDLAEAAHVDGTTRPQTVTVRTSPRYHALIRHVEALTGVGAVLNTSLNGRGEPIADSPLDAVRILYTTGLDAVAIEDCVIVKDPELWRDAAP